MFVISNESQVKTLESLSALVPTHANEDPNKVLNYSECLKCLHVPQNMGPLFAPWLYHLVGYLSQGRVKFLKTCQAHSRLEVASKTVLVWLILRVTAR